MSKKYILAIDIGTSACKLTVFDLLGNVIFNYLGEYKTYYYGDNCVEQNAEDWWKQVCKGINKIKIQETLDVKDIVAIGVDGHSWAALPVDDKGLPLRRAMIWLDRRATEQAEYMKEMIGEEKLLQNSGNPVDPAYITAKMLWIKENESDIYKSTYKFLQSNSYIVYKLTGKYSQDLSQGYGFHYFDIEKGVWNGDIAKELGISLDLMSPLYQSHEVVAKVTNSVAVKTGLQEGTPVVAGGLDAACCTLGAGVIEPGQTQEQGGQAGGMSIQVDQPLIHPKLILGYHVIPNQWLLQGGTVGGGGILRWFKDELGYYEQTKASKMEINSYQVMSREAEKINPGSNGLIFLPYMAGERSPIWNSKARGILFGLSYNNSRSDIIRSMMEGVGYSLRHNLDTAEEAEAYVKELRSVGGSANSKVWTQLKADIIGKEVLVPYADHATSLGAAILAGVGTGIYKGFKEAVQKTIRITRVHKPDKDRHQLYSKYYKLYLDLYKNNRKLFEDLCEIK